MKEKTIKPPCTPEEKWRDNEMIGNPKPQYEQPRYGKFAAIDELDSSKDFVGVGDEGIPYYISTMYLKINELVEVVNYLLGKPNIKP